MNNDRRENIGYRKTNKGMDSRKKILTGVLRFRMQSDVKTLFIIYKYGRR